MQGPGFDPQHWKEEEGRKGGGERGREGAKGQRDILGVIVKGELKFCLCRLHRGIMSQEIA